jgi:hypothetical protein
VLRSGAAACLITPALITPVEREPGTPAARQMFEKHGFEAIARAAQNAIACESRGEADEASEWRHLEDAMKMMRGPHQS